MAPAKIDNQKFLEIIENTPLVSIDLILRDSRNRLLLGRRVNEPAKGKWFVPGGRIRKDESIDEAFERISVEEIGRKFSRTDARLLDVYTHWYDTNFLSRPGISTHHVVLAYEIGVPENFQIKTREQHSDYRWFSSDEADPAVSDHADPDVHEYVLPYFRALSA